MRGKRMVYVVNVQLVIDPEGYGYDALTVCEDVCLDLLTNQTQKHVMGGGNLVDWRFPDHEVQLVYVHPKATYQEDEAFDVLDARYQDREEE